MSSFWYTFCPWHRVRGHEQRFFLGCVYCAHGYLPRFLQVLMRSAFETRHTSCFGVGLLNLKGLKCRTADRTRNSPMQEKKEARKKFFDRTGLTRWVRMSSDANPDSMKLLLHCRQASTAERTFGWGIATGGTCWGGLEGQSTILGEHWTVGALQTFWKGKNETNFLCRRNCRPFDWLSFAFKAVTCNCQISKDKSRTA